MHIRLLDKNDAARFHMLRLHGTQESPDAFDPTYDEEQQQTLQMVAQRLEPKGSPFEHFVVGAFDEHENLQGIAGFTREIHQKKSHKAWIWGVYVSPVLRRHGTGRALLEEVLKQANLLAELEQIHVSVTTTNTKAIELYRSLGFQRYGIIPSAMKFGDLYLDEELMMFPVNTSKA